MPNDAASPQVFVSFHTVDTHFEILGENKMFSNQIGKQYFNHLFKLAELFICVWWKDWNQGHEHANKQVL